MTPANPPPRAASTLADMLVGCCTVLSIALALCLLALIVAACYGHWWG